MSMLYLAQTAAESRPGFALGYIAAKLLIIGIGVYGLVKLVSSKRKNKLPPPRPNYTAPGPYTGNYWAQPGWPPPAPPAAPRTPAPWPPQPHRPTWPR
jgi:hypothetical protein